MSIKFKFLPKLWLDSECEKVEKHEGEVKLVFTMRFFPLVANGREN